MKAVKKERWLAVAKWSATGLLAAACLGTWLWQLEEKNQEVRALSAPERRDLYERTLQTLRTVCTHPPGADLKDYCREQADLIVRFPECDDTCLAALKRLEPRATR